MIDIIFGWLTRPYYKWTALDTIMLILEIVLIFGIGSFASNKIKEIKNRRKK